MRRQGKRQKFSGACRIEGGVLQGWVADGRAEPGEPGIAVVTQHGGLVGQGVSGVDAGAPFPRAGFAIALGAGCFGAGELVLSVLADGEKFAEIPCHFSLLGEVEMLTPEACAGWLTAPDAPHRQWEIEILRDGVPVATALCNLLRQDVPGLKPGHEHCGFAAQFPLGAAAPVAPASIAFRLRGSGAPLFGGPYIVARREAAVLAAQRAARVLHHADLGMAEKAALAQALAGFTQAARGGAGFAFPQPLPENLSLQPLRLNIVIPVYGDLPATRECIASVLAHRNAATDRVILIDDASPEPGMAELLAGHASQPNLFVLSNPRNLGFVASVNRGIGFAAGDVLLLNADTIVYPGAFDMLCAVATARPEIGTVTALSNDATIFSYPVPDMPCDFLEDCSWPELAEAALAGNGEMAVEVPTAHGFCMLIKAGLLRLLGGFDAAFGRGYCEENDFCVRAADLGFVHVAAAGVFVRHHASRSFGAEKAALLERNIARLAARYPEYLPALQAFGEAGGIRRARWALDGWRLRRAREAGAQFLLVISNDLGGGAARAAADIENAGALPAAEKLDLVCRADGSMALSARAPLFSAVFSAEETDALFEILTEADPRQWVAHQLLGFSEAFMRRLPEWAKGRYGVYYAHDFYPLCPRVTMFDSTRRFCGLAPPEQCNICLRAGAHEAERLGLDAASHRALFGAVLRGFTRVVAPSADAAGYFRRGFPELPVQVIPHPESLVLPAPRWAADAEEILLLGAIGPAKGSGKLLELAQLARLKQPHLTFRVIGYTDIDAALLEVGNVVITGRYTPEALPRLADEARGSIALFLHEWPETWSYTLSEALRHGFTPLVPDLGAPAERLRALGVGLIYPYPADAAQILQLLLKARRAPH